jgi:Calx-beta domain-containing protein/VCBS repeat protein
MQTSTARLRIRALVVTLLAACGAATTASAATVVHSCLGSAVDGYGTNVSGAHVRFWLTRPDDSTVVLAAPPDVPTGADGRAAVTVVFEKATPVELHCRIVQDGLLHKIRAHENVTSYDPHAPAGQQVSATALMAPAWTTGSGTDPSFGGLREDGPDHGRGHARLYQSGAYDKVVVIPQGMDFFERTPGRATADDLWFAFSDGLKALYARGYDVWLFRPYLTGENIHEQAAEFAQAIQHASGFGPGAQGGKVIVAGYSLGALVARTATARWEADAQWRQSLGLETDAPPANLVAFMDGALRGANVNRKLQDKIWEGDAQVKTNLASCAAGQLLRDSKGCFGSSCFHDFFETGDGFTFFSADGTCDAHEPLGLACHCDAGPAISTLNGDGFPHEMDTIAFSAGTWNPPMNLCHGGVRDQNVDGQDVCPSDPGGDGPFAPQVGDTWWTVRCHGPFGTILHSEHFDASPADLAPGSRFTLAFEQDPHMLDLLPSSWLCASMESIQNFAFTFIPIDSALAGDSEEESPFPPDHRMTATYQAVHNRPPEQLLGWLLGKFDAAYGEDPCGGCGGGLAPTAPGNLVASPLVGGWDQIDLTWEDRSNNEDVFVIQRLLSGEPAWHTIATVSANTTTFRDDPSTGLRIPTQAEGTLFYFYRVIARNDYGSGESNRADTRLYNQPPGVSDDLHPRGCIDDLLPELSWRGGDRSTSYYVRLLDAQTGLEAMPDQEVTVAHLRTSVPLEPRKPYMLRIWGQNNVGWGTGSSPEFFRTFCEPVDPPEFLEPVGCIDDLTPVLKWTAVTDALSYHVRVFKAVDIEHDVLVYDGGPTGTSVEIPAAQALEPGKDYRVWVKPHTAGTSDPYSRIRFFTTMCDQAPGAGFVSPIAPGLASTNQPEFLFETASHADSYRLEVYDQTGTHLVYAREYPAASVCANGLCNVRPDVSLSVGVHAWWVRAGRNFVFDPHAMWGWVTVPDLPTVSIGPASASEATGALSFPVTLSAPAVLPVTFSVRTEDGTALQNTDFLPLAGSWTMPVGATALSVTVPLVDDAVHEDTETLRVRLSAVNGASLGVAVATGTVVDDDPLPSFVPGSVMHPESGPAGESFWSVPIGLVGQSDHDVLVNYSVESCTAEAGSDFVAASGELRFSPGEAVEHVPVIVLDDAQAEGHEIVRITLSDPQGGVITENWAQATIANDDAPSLGRLRSDFDGDGNNDLVWQDAAGRLQLWRMVGVNKIGAAVPFNPPAPVEAGWKFAATADFNGDGAPDLVWQNVNSGRLAFWFMNGVNRTSGQLVDGYGDPAWKLVATGQFNADAWTDLVWRHELTGEVRIWLMAGLKHAGDATPPQPAAAGWNLEGVGDFDGNGRRDDPLWRHPVSGTMVVWLMDGVVRRESRILTPTKPADWRLVGLMDIDANGTTDLVWQHDDPSQLAAWLMSGTTQTCPMYLTPRVSEAPGWTVAGPR